MRHFKERRRFAQSLIETVVGIIFMVPIVLFLFDVAVLVLGNTANDNLAKQAARAAASAVNSSTGSGSPTVGQSAAQTIINQFGTSGFIDQVAFAYMYYDDNGASGQTETASPNSSLNSLDGSNGLPAVATNDPGAGNVAVVVAMEVRPPVPFPVIGTNRIFFARAVEPIVSIPPQ